MCKYRPNSCVCCPFKVTGNDTSDTNFDLLVLRAKSPELAPRLRLVERGEDKIAGTFYNVLTCSALKELLTSNYSLKLQLILYFIR